LPYLWTRRGIQRINHHDREPAVFYIHPWEVDPEQPRLPAGRITGFRHYRNLGRTETRLRRLLRDFRFGTVEEVLTSTSRERAVVTFQEGGAMRGQRSAEAVQ
jgi:hypothetical protein